MGLALKGLSRFSTQPKTQDKNVNISKNEKSFRHILRAFNYHAFSQTRKWALNVYTMFMDIAFLNFEAKD